MGAVAGINLGTQIVGAVLGPVSSLLAAHTARLKGATNENAALDAIIPAFDADLQNVAAYYNSGKATEAECLEALQYIDAKILQYLLQQVGPAGTAWGGPKNLGTKINASYSATCDKLCTAGCCVYLNDLRPAIYGRSGLGSAYQPFQTSPGVAGGLFQAIQNGGGTVHVITVAKPPNTKYGNYERAGYSLTIKKPLFVKSAGTLINQTVAGLSGYGNSSQQQQQAFPTPQAASADGILATAPDTQTLLLLGLGLIAVAVIMK